MIARRSCRQSAVRLFRREPTPPPPAVPSFGEWTLRAFTRDERVAEMTFARLEQVCSNAASLLIGAAYAEPGAAGEAAGSDGAAADAALLARRTADGFRAALADRQHAILAWPWDHLATKAAWDALRAERAAEGPLGDELWRVAAAYARGHRNQLQHVLTLWEQVAAGVLDGSRPRPDLAVLGGEALSAYRRSLAAPQA